MSESPHFVHVFSTFAAAGPQVRTTDLMNRLEDPIRHTVIAMDRNYECAKRVQPHVAFETKPPPDLGRAWQAPHRLGKFLKGLQPDLILTYNWGAIESIAGARLLGMRRLIHAEDGFGTDEVVTQKARRVWTRRCLLRMVRRVIVPSQRLRSICREIWRLPDALCEYIPNGIDTERFCPGESAPGRKSLGIDDQSFVIGTVAKFRPEKALELLIEAFALVRGKVPAKLLLVGAGAEEAKLRARIDELGLNQDVILPGQIPEPMAIYRAMNVFSLSSVTEQMPVSVVEAMASGLPVVSTNVGDVRTMVADANQPLIIEGRDPELMAQQFLRLAEDSALRTALAQANREKALSVFQDRVMLEQYRRIYFEVLRS